ncbi:GNAT family N-acetyltransferase [Promicromonospora sp. NPDC057138]|uniref:GNAT family N-acetyltransferase n=1 Tax=Promicromonospora sp. NPDC057138 TaxID=3346031 RepID=UPI003645930D
MSVPRHAGRHSIRPDLEAVIPTFGLRVRWDDLELRLADDPELLALAELAADGVHGPDVSPFSRPWAQGTREEVRRSVVTRQWIRRGRIAVDDWSLALGVFRDGEIIGTQAVSAKDFQVTRSGHTGSWLGLRHQGQGIGTRMRLMALHLAFEGLDAAEMLSEAFEDNPASNAVSRRLGYTANGSRVTAREGNSVVEKGYRMTRQLWDARPENLRPEIMLDGLSPVRTFFGIDRPDHAVSEAPPVPGTTGEDEHRGP